MKAVMPDWKVKKGHILSIYKRATEQIYYSCKVTACKITNFVLFNFVFTCPQKQKFARDNLVKVKIIMQNLTSGDVDAMQLYISVWTTISPDIRSTIMTLKCSEFLETMQVFDIRMKIIVFWKVIMYSIHVFPLIPTAEENPFFAGYITIFWWMPAIF